MSRCGPFSLLRPLGAGGMGQVWLARGPAGLAVVKRVHAARPELLRQFLTEARVSARLQHPNLARTLEVGEADAQPYLALELVDGPSLAALLAAVGPLPAGAVARLVASVAGALHAAHTLRDANGAALALAHGDVCTRNVLVRRDGTPVLIDFGLAQLRQHAGGDDEGLAGTLHALAPEQLEGAPADAKTDQFALGTLAYELLAGRAPFEGESDVQTLDLVAAAAPPWPAAWPDDLIAVLQRSLSPNPASRFPDCDELRRALEAFAADEPRVDLAALVGRAAGPPVPELATAPAPSVGPSPVAALGDVGTPAQRQALEGLAAPLASEPRALELLRRNLTAQTVAALLAAAPTSLSGVRAWVCTLLAPEELAGLRQLEEVGGEHTLEQLEGRLQLDTFPGVWALDVIQALADRGLLEAREGPDGERRFSL